MKLALLLAVLLTATAMAGPPNDQPETLEILLDEIWGYALPGTRDIAGLPLPEDRPIQITDASLRRQRENQIELIRQQLASQPTTEVAASGFVIPRQPDLEALRRFRIPTRPKDRLFARESYPEGTDLTLAFFSYPSAYYVRLKKVEREEGQITVYYQFEPHKTDEVTVHFAMIPLGKLPAGNYQVIYERIPMERKYLEEGFQPANDGVICRPFVFTVSELPKDEPAPEGTTLIPLHDIWGYRMPGMKDVRQLDTVVRAPSGAWTYTILDNWFGSLNERRGEPAGPAFIVPGAGRQALQNILVDQPHSFPAGTDLSLVFFTHMSGGHYIHVVSVERVEQRIIVRYQPIVHGTGDATFHFALIPLGPLAADEYHVEIKPVPAEDTQGRVVRPVSGLERIVCQSTSFYVHQGEE